GQATRRGLAMSAGAGVVIRVADQRRFVSAARAKEIVSGAVISPVPATNIGMTLLSGRVIPVIQVGPEHDLLLVCELDGETFALSGASVVQAGFFEQSGDGVLFDGERVPPLDVAAELTRAEARLASAGSDR